LLNGTKKALGFVNVILLQNNSRHFRSLMWPSSWWWEQEYKCSMSHYI